MALVYRDGRPYLYRSFRRNGRVTSEHVASGAAAILIDQIETVDRDERHYQNWHEGEERKRFEELERGLDALCEEARTFAEAALTEAGYHRHDRGEWRKRRGDRSRDADSK
jgi:hypothetical protein